jgi:hypothetical protein
MSYVHPRLINGPIPAIWLRVGADGFIPRARYGMVHRANTDALICYTGPWGCHAPSPLLYFHIVHGGDLEWCLLACEGGQ